MTTGFTWNIAANIAARVVQVAQFARIPAAGSPRVARHPTLPAGHAVFEATRTGGASSADAAHSTDAAHSPGTAAGTDTARVAPPRRPPLPGTAALLGRLLRGQVTPHRLV